MNTKKQIPLPPFWTAEDAYIVINFLNTIIDAIREIHGIKLAASSPLINSSNNDDPRPF